MLSNITKHGFFQLDRKHCALFKASELTGRPQIREKATSNRGEGHIFEAYVKQKLRWVKLSLN